MKKAFTMIELVFVIIVAGILAAVAIPKMGENELNTAVDQVVSHIRYTQHLAMQDNKFDPNNANWFKGRWQLMFGKSDFTGDKYAYTIFSDSPGYSGNPNGNEVAKNPANSKQLLTGGYSGFIRTSDKRAMKALNIGKKYGIVDVNFTGGCSGNAKRISFDNYGRPFKGNLSSSSLPYQSNRIVRETCYITLCTQTCPSTIPATNKKVARTIAVEPETGYTHVL